MYIILIKYVYNIDFNIFDTLVFRREYFIVKFVSVLFVNRLKMIMLMILIKFNQSIRIRKF